MIRDILSLTWQEFLTALVLGVFGVLAAASLGCAVPKAITYPDGGQHVYCGGEWWSKPVNGRAMFKMPPGWAPEAYR